MGNSPLGAATTWTCAIAVIALLASTFCAQAAVAASYGQQKAMLEKAGRDLRTAERLARSGRDKDAAEMFAAAANAVREVGGDLHPKLVRTHERAVASLGRYHEQLTAAGVTLPALDAMAPTLGGRNPAGPNSGRGASDDQVSFTGEIAPTLVQFCGRCHIDQRRGQFSMRSYDDLMRAQVVEVGAGNESRLVDVIAGGSMPPAGDAPSPQQTARLVRWINQGAKFDGDDPAKSLREIQPGDGTPTPPPEPAPVLDAPQVTMPRGNESVSFALDVAPILNEACLNCHNQGQSRAGLSVMTFDSLLEGGDSGPMIVPGKADDSLLVQKIRGTAAEGQRMPLNRPALSADQIAAIATWINEGAAFDGDAPDLPLTRVAAVARVARSTPQELATMRRAAAERNWRLALPDEQMARVEGASLHVVGNLPEGQLKELLAAANAELPGVQKELGAAGEDWLKGPLTIYAFPSRIDYTEFCTMVEQRQTDRGVTGHARYDAVEPYMVLVADSSDAERRDALLCQLLGEIATAHRGQGGLPDWFVVGSGRAAAARLHARSPVVNEWKEKTDAVIASVRNPKDFSDGQLATSTRDLIAAAFVADIRAKRGNFDKLITAVADGQTFDQAVQAVYRVDAKKLTEMWFQSRRR